MMAGVKAIANRAGRWYILRIVRSAKESHRPRRTNERPIEYGFVMEWLNALQPRMVLDVGTGESELPALMARCGFRVDAIDNVRDYWSRAMLNRHWPVEDVNIVRPPEAFLRRQYDMVTCISVLEHIEDAEGAVRNMLAVVRQGGHLIMSFPYSDDPAYRHPNVYEVEGSYGAGQQYKASQYSRPDLDRWLMGSEAVGQRYFRAFTSRWWSVGDLVRPIERVRPDEPHQLTCLVVRKATG
jgi:SAM-dependent methyltransferase